MDKSAFLENIRRRLDSARLPEAEETLPPLALAHLPAGAVLVPQFVEALAAVDGHAHHVHSEPEAAALLEHLFEQYQARGYLAWDDAHLPVPGIHDDLTGRGYARGQTLLSAGFAARQAEQRALAEIEIGLTGALAGIADTGTLVLQMGAGRGRFVSLLPAVHIALLKSEQIFPTLNHFIRAHAGVNFATSNTVMITGPSRTADIEGVLTLGVHGPKTLHVIVLG